jgi:hypothetical protein
VGQEGEVLTTVVVLVGVLQAIMMIVVLLVAQKSRVRVVVTTRLGSRLRL